MSVNKVILVGNLGKDPELRYTPSGAAVCSFSLATTEKFKDREPKTEWHNIVAWKQLAEICAQYLHKGKEIYIEGRIQTRSYDKDGGRRYMTEIIADKMQMFGGKEETQRQTNQAPAGAYSGRETPTFNPDDEIPF